MFDIKNKKVFIFDLDGVITSTDKYHFEAWKIAVEKIGIYLDKDFEKFIKGIGREECLRLIINKHNKIIDEEEFNSILEFKNNYYINLLSNFSEENIFHGSVELLEYLKENKIMIILSSASKNATFIINKINLIKYFDIIIKASEIKKTKPDPEIFMKSVEASGHKKEDCIVIEDSQSGINASIAINLDTIAYEPIGDTLTGYTLKVKSHYEILNLLKRGTND